MKVIRAEHKDSLVSRPERAAEGRLTYARRALDEVVATRRFQDGGLKLALERGARCDVPTARVVAAIVGGLQLDPGPSEHLGHARDGHGADGAVELEAQDADDASVRDHRGARHAVVVLQPSGRVDGQVGVHPQQRVGEKLCDGPPEDVSDVRLALRVTERPPRLALPARRLGKRERIQPRRHVEGQDRDVQVGGLREDPGCNGLGDAAERDGRPGALINRGQDAVSGREHHGRRDEVAGPLLVAARHPARSVSEGVVEHKLHYVSMSTHPA